MTIRTGTAGQTSRRHQSRFVDWSLSGRAKVVLRCGVMRGDPPK